MFISENSEVAKSFPSKEKKSKNCKSVKMPLKGITLRVSRKIHQLSKFSRPKLESHKNETMKSMAKAPRSTISIIVS
jgi:hypothetical protein